MANFNKVILVGNLTRDPGLRTTTSGNSVCEFSVAVNRTWGSVEDRKQETLFIGVTAWGKTAETIARYCSKGDPLLVEGRLASDSWEADGVKRTKIYVVAESFQFLRARAETTSESFGGRATSSPSQFSDDAGDVPF